MNNQANRQTDKRRIKHNRLGGGKHNQMLVDGVHTNPVRRDLAGRGSTYDHAIFGKVLLPSSGRSASAAPHPVQKITVVIGTGCQQ